MKRWRQYLEYAYPASDVHSDKDFSTLQGCLTLVMVHYVKHKDAIEKKGIEFEEKLFFMEQFGILCIYYDAIGDQTLSKLYDNWRVYWLWDINRK